MNTFTKKLSDEALIELISKGNEAAFRELFDRFYKKLVGISFIMIRDQDKAQDLAQDVFIKVWEKRSELQIHSSVSGYLKRAVSNTTLNHIKASKKFSLEEEDDRDIIDPSAADDEMQTNELKQVIDRSISELPDRCRVIFVMKRFEGMSHKEISKELDISTKTIENQMTKALKYLKEKIDQYNEEGNRG